MALRICRPVLFAASVLCAQNHSPRPFEGRWDLAVKTPVPRWRTYPSWLEVTYSDGSPHARVVGRVSSVHPVENLKIKGSTMAFSTSEYFDRPIQVEWTFTENNGRLIGAQKRSDGVEGQIRGLPAPSLDRPQPSSWSKPLKLFNGKDLTGWEPDDPAQNHWRAVGGELVNEAAGANIRTTRRFQDFKLHIEYNCPAGGNSGIYLRGRYEVQVEYEPAGENDSLHKMGSIYGFLGPAKEIKARPGQWESYDITLVGRTVTVVRDGVTIIARRQIPGITGGALDNAEAEPGLLYLQGDHTGGMKYRKITISLSRNGAREAQEPQ
jgi:Domain of Unknown Function (DUF1080)